MPINDAWPTLTLELPHLTRDVLEAAFRPALNFNWQAGEVLKNATFAKIIERAIYMKTGDWPETSTMNAIMKAVDTVTETKPVDTIICGLHIAVYRLHDELVLAVEKA